MENLDRYCFFFLKKKKAQKAKLNTKRKVSQIPILEAS